MPSSGLSDRPGSATTRSRSTLTPPRNCTSARISWPVTTPPAVFDCTLPSASSCSSRASAVDSAVPVAPVSTRKSTARPLMRPGQW